MNELIPDCKIEGEILLDNKNVYTEYDINILRKKVGMVFQKPNLFPMSIYDNIAYGPRTHGVTKKAALEEIVVTSLQRAAVWEESLKFCLWTNQHLLLILFLQLKLKIC